jgi:hypothetical protein
VGKSEIRPGATDLNFIQIHFTSDSLIGVENSVNLPDSQESEYSVSGANLMQTRQVY